MGSRGGEEGEQKISTFYIAPFLMPFHLKTVMKLAVIYPCAFALGRNASLRELIKVRCIAEAKQYCQLCMQFSPHPQVR